MVAFDVLIQQERWEEAEKRLEKLKSRSCIKKGFNALRTNPRAPPTLLEALVVKLGGYSTYSLKTEDSVTTYEVVLRRGRTRMLGRLLTRNVATLWTAFLRDSGGLKETSKAQLLSVSKKQDLEGLPELLCLWQKTRLFIREYMRATQKLYCPLRSNKKFLVVHTIADMDCPTIVMWFALRIYRRQLRERDQFGRLPLHILAAKPPNDVSIEGIEFVGKLKPAGRSMLYCALSKFREGAKFVDKDGKLPLTLALESEAWQYRWHHETPTERIKMLAEAAPEALTTRNPTTGFWPYLSAASNDQSLDSVYELLRGNPAVLRLLPPTKLDLLTKENESLATQVEELKSHVSVLTGQLRDQHLENAKLRDELARSNDSGTGSKKRKGEEIDDEGAHVQKKKTRVGYWSFAKFW